MLLQLSLLLKFVVDTSSDAESLLVHPEPDFHEGDEDDEAVSTQSNTIIAGFTKSTFTLTDFQSDQQVRDCDSVFLSGIRSDLVLYYGNCPNYVIAYHTLLTSNSHPL